jgi:membrane associated rhomboid family serine protease
MRRRILTLILIALAVVWTGWISLSANGDSDWRRFGISDGFQVFGGDYWTLVTSIFVHIGVLHLLFNVYWLYI